MRDARDSGGFVAVIVAVGLFGLALFAGVLSAVAIGQKNQKTAEVLMDPGANLSSVSDQDIKNLQNQLPNSAGILTNAAALGTPILPSGQSTLEVGASAIAQAVNDPVRPAVVGYMSDPASSWNKNGGANRPSEGTNPTGGQLPGPPAASGANDSGSPGITGVACPVGAVCRYCVQSAMLTLALPAPAMSRQFPVTGSFVIQWGDSSHIQTLSLDVNQALSMKPYLSYQAGYNLVPQSSSATAVHVVETFDSSTTGLDLGAFNDGVYPSGFRAKTADLVAQFGASSVSGHVTLVDPNGAQASATFSGMAVAASSTCP
jgi:hypothetical protein